LILSGFCEIRWRRFWSTVFLIPRIFILFKKTLNKDRIFMELYVLGDPSYAYLLLSGCPCRTPVRGLHVAVIINYIFMSFDSLMPFYILSNAFLSWKLTGQHDIPRAASPLDSVVKHRKQPPLQFRWRLSVVRWRL
jgi:hypothetical protein